MTIEEKTGTKSRMSFYRKLRIVQVRILARFLILLGESNEFHRLLRGLRTMPVLRSLVGWALAYRRTYPSFAEAQQNADRFIPAGHEHEDDVQMHVRLADRIRESDYPVLYYWKQLQEEPLEVFDFAGNVGNVFYAYDKLLNFPANLQWLVYDLPEIREAGKAVAVARQEARVTFADSIDAAAGCDVFLASGCLHYFEKSLCQLLRPLDSLPKHVIANRVPVCDGPEIITVQDNKSYLVPCKLHNRKKLVHDMEKLGYRLKGSWTAHELALFVPLYPESSCETYSGFYFELE